MKIIQQDNQNIDQSVKALI